MTSENAQENKLQILGKLTASLIHEIRNPLSAIKLNLDYLKMIENELPTEAIESVEFSLDALSRIQYLVDNVLSFSRKSLNGVKQCSINEITRNAISIMKYEAERKNVKIEFEPDETIAKSEFDKSRLLQVFLNLITNAIESCINGGYILIKTYKKLPDFFIWEITDTGSGICEEDKAKIFNDFYTSKEKGTGLGLSVCKMILQEYNAEIDFESTLGKGTKFILKFNSNLLQSSHEVQNINYR
jgi:signal transduction histidine kinase